MVVAIVVCDLILILTFVDLSVMDSPFAMFESVALQLNEMSQVISGSINCTMDIARERIEADADVTEESLSSLKKTMLEFLDLQKNVTNFHNAFEDVKRQSLLTYEVPDDLDQILISEYKKSYDEEIKFTPMEDSAHYRQMLDFIAASIGGGDGLSYQPLVTDTGDVEMTEQRVIPLDPISKREVVNPVFNTICMHVYERDNIVQYIKSKGGRVKCPMAGCMSKDFVTLAMLQEDVELKSLIYSKKHSLDKF